MRKELSGQSSYITLLGKFAKYDANSLKIKFLLTRF